MPLTTQESILIKSKIDDTIYCLINSPDSAYDVDEAGEELFFSLLSVAYNTDNYSVRTSIFMLYQLYNPGWSIPFDEFESLMQRYWDDQIEMAPWEWCGISEEEYNSLATFAKVRT
jgi:hypothetical protein